MPILVMPEEQYTEEELFLILKRKLCRGKRYRQMKEENRRGDLCIRIRHFRAVYNS